MLFIFIAIVFIAQHLTHEKPMQPIPSERMSAQIAGKELAVE